MTSGHKDFAKAVNTSPASRHARYEWLDGLRAYAIFGVVLVHAADLAFRGSSPTPFHHAAYGLAWFGQQGVQLFFVISALTVYYTLGRFPFSWETFGAWLLKRFMRIAPLYYVALVAGFVITILLNRARVHSHMVPFQNFTLREALANIFFVNTWTKDGNNTVVPGGWSISVEMMFYLAAPLLFLLMKEPVRAAFTALVLTLLGLCLTYYANSHFPDDSAYYYFWFPAQLPVILCGLLLCTFAGPTIFSSKTIRRRTLTVAAAIGILAVAIACPLAPRSLWLRVLTLPLWGIAFSCLILFARGPLRPLFANRLAVWIGRISYSLYLVHITALRIIGGAVTQTRMLSRMSPFTAWLILFILISGVSILIAIFTRRWVEEPSIRLGQRLSTRLTATSTR